MRHRINITLPEATLELIDRAAERGNRSRLIDQAVRDFLRRRSRLHLRKRLREAARTHAARDLRLARDWFLLDEEAWRKTRR